MVTAEQCPRIPGEFLEEQRRELGPLLFRQEYNCEFWTTLRLCSRPRSWRRLFIQASRLYSPSPRREIGYVHPISHTLGADLGQSHDPTAICVIETMVTKRCFYDGWSAEPRRVPEGVEHRVRHLERLALGTPYPAQVEVVLGLYRSPLLTDPGAGA